MKFHKVKPYLTPPNQDFFETSDQLNTSWLVRLSVARLLWTDLKLLYVSSVIRLVLNTKSLWKDNAYYATILKVQTLSSIHLPVTIVCYIQHRKRCFHICVIKKKIWSTTELALRKLFWIMSSSSLNFDIPSTISSLNVSVSLILIILELAFLQCFCANSFLFPSFIVF